ncbi:Aldo/keto reductase [Lentithecium fluviatile CBS 122367]|uniref:Aldo/keto reductase n=1 Tax=Lentithecium fluviatile CBS 122367 TaxID=1168545 RepID=A0A6G1JDL5_9PLEO|nr:Aldo/keto reductase [Lentithecium fluviatile CBS 122367]
MTPPQYLFGAGHFGVTWSSEDVAHLAEVLQKVGINRIDSAATYPITSPGTAESFLGENDYIQKGFQIDTKVLWFDGGNGTLTEEAIEKSVAASLERLKTDKVNVFYCHAPDKSTPIADQAAAMDTQYKKGRFDRLGICNFSTEMLEEWLQVAEEKNFVKPSIFQGQYNLVCRAYETSLFPLLEKHGISFIAASPLAGGFLTGKVTFSTSNEDLKGTRFEVVEGNIAGMGFRYWYDKPSIHEAVRKLAAACEPYGISTTDASIRWLLYHAPLPSQKDNGVIIGPSNISQIESYLMAREQGALPAALVKEVDALWDIVKDDASSIIVY